MAHAPLLAALLLATQPTEDPSSLEGRWHLTVHLPVVQRAPVLGDTSRDFVMHALVEVTSEDGVLTQRTRPCAVQLGGGGATRVEVPRGFPEAISVPPSSLEAEGERIATSLPDIRVGYRATDGDEAPPTDEDDPRVLDADGDGEPGASVILHVFEIGEVKLFVVLRLDLDLEGERANGRYEGVVRVRSFEQNIIGSAPPLPVVDQVRTTGEDGRFTLERTGERDQADACPS